MDLSVITDPTNPFTTNDLSEEAMALLGYLAAAGAELGADMVATCTTDHPKLTNSGNVSRHRMPGTGGEGLAIDARLRQRGSTPDLHRAVFDAFLRVEGQLHELIYGFAPFNIKAGRRVLPFAVSDHRDHVHISVDRGVRLAFRTSNPVVPLLEGETMFFKSDEDRLAWQVTYTYTTLLGRPPENAQVLAQRIEQLKTQGFARLWQEVAESEEARRREARLAHA